VALVGEILAAQPIRSYLISPHAAQEMRRRGIAEEVVAHVLAAPGQRLPVRPGREVLQSKFEAEPPARPSLVRVFVDVDREPAEVVTAYRTSKVDKYWAGTL
jgi:hypothetical protein